MKPEHTRVTELRCSVCGRPPNVAAIKLAVNSQRQTTYKFKCCGVQHWLHTKGKAK